jgi:hypothetical protein
MVLFGSEKRRKHQSLTLDQQPPRYMAFPTKYDEYMSENDALTSPKRERKATPESPSPSPARRREKWTDSIKSKAKFLMMASKDAKDEECMPRSSPIPIPSPHLAPESAPAVVVSIPHSRLSSGSLEGFLSPDRHKLELPLGLPALMVVKAAYS